MSIDLLRFPPEIFACICEFAGTMSTIRFWLSGDVKVIQLMSVRCGIRKMHLEDMTIGSTSRWPTMLAQCPSITELTVTWPSNALSIPLDELMSMKNLRVLGLDCAASNGVVTSNLLPSFKNLEDLSLGYLNSPVMTSSLPQTITRLSLLFSGSITNPLSVAGGFTMPNLTKFKLWNFDNFTMTTPLEFDLEELDTTSSCNAPHWKVPNTLKKLFITEVISSSHDFDHWYSTNLVELKVHKIDSRSLSTLPLRNLIHLKTFIWESHDSDLQCISTNSQPMFPASLEYLTLMLRINFDKALILPHALRSLQIREMGDYKLVTEVSPSESSTTPTPLPRDEVTFQNYVDELTVLGIPKSLTFLSLNFSIFRIKTFLVSPSIWQHNNSGVSLQTLRLMGVEIDRNPIELLPDTLTELSLFDTYPMSNDQFIRFTDLKVLVFHSPMRRVNFKYFHNLPICLSVLRLCFRGNFDESIVKFLPRGLEELDIAIDNEKRHLIPTLSKDSFLLLKEFKELTQLRLKLNLCDLEDWMLGVLSRSLIRLDLDFEFGTKCTSSCFAYLPSNLRILQFNRLKSIDDAHFADLPRGLRQLYVRFEGVAVSTSEEENVPHLALGMPQTLTVCVVNHKRYKAINKHFPPSSINEERRLPKGNEHVIRLADSSHTDHQPSLRTLTPRFLRYVSMLTRYLVTLEN